MVMMSLFFSHIYRIQEVKKESGKNKRKMIDGERLGGAIMEKEGTLTEVTLL